MLNKLSTIAIDLLGLHGYPVQPAAWRQDLPTRQDADLAAPGAVARTTPVAQGRLAANRAHGHAGLPLIRRPS